MFIKLGNKTVIIETKEHRGEFHYTDDMDKAKVFIEKHLTGDEFVQCSSDVNHPTEFGIPESFNIDDWLHMVLHPKHTYNLIDNDTLKVMFNPNKGEYEITVKDSSKVIVNF